jgi:2-desacetyl-2-hydroxyethyl bacteriochlorophyllide A dehydrogenase
MPRRSAAEALVRVRLAGICDTDLQLAAGYMGFRGVLGHEFVGQVVECDDRSWLHARVVADINAACGACDACARGDRHHCPSRTVLGIAGRDGCLAEYTLVPEPCLVRVPDAVSDDAAAFAEPLAAALHVVDCLPPGAGDILVLGDGKLGLLTAMAVHAGGRNVKLVGHHESKLAIARAAGVDTALREDRDGWWPAVVEATGHPMGLADALRACRPRGTIVLKTTVAAPAAVDLSPVVIHELQIVGSRCGDLELAVRSLATGAIDPAALIEARYPLQQADRALQHAQRKGALKIVVEVEPRA